MRRARVSSWCTWLGSVASCANLVMASGSRTLVLVIALVSLARCVLNAQRGLLNAAQARVGPITKERCVAVVTCASLVLAQLSLLLLGHCLSLLCERGRAIVTGPFVGSCLLSLLSLTVDGWLMAAGATFFFRLRDEAKKEAALDPNKEFILHVLGDGNPMLVGADITCAICLMSCIGTAQCAREFAAQPAAKLPCGHIYHTDCICEWLKRDPLAQCPTCKSRVGRPRQNPLQEQSVSGSSPPSEESVPTATAMGLHNTMSDRQSQREHAVVESIAVP